MTSSIQSLEQTFAVRYHEVDPRGMVRLPVVMTWLQDAGIEHSRKMGVSVNDLAEKGLIWVLSRLTLQMERYPGCAEEILVRTWPVTRKGLFSIRDYYLLDDNAIIIGRATTSWAVLDLKTRRPVRISEHLPSYQLKDERALDDPFETLPVLEGGGSGALELPVLRADLDQNCHVNNTVYAGWAIEAVPAEIADNSIATTIEIGFRAEAVYGDSIRSICSPAASDPPTVIHRIEHAADGRELARMRTTWRAVTPPSS